LFWFQTNWSLYLKKMHFSDIIKRCSKLVCCFGVILSLIFTYSLYCCIRLLHFKNCSLGSFIFPYIFPFTAVFLRCRVMSLFPVIFLNMTSKVDSHSAMNGWETTNVNLVVEPQKHFFQMGLPWRAFDQKWARILVKCVQLNCKK